MKVGFIGLGNVGSKLAGSLLRQGFAMTVLDLDPSAVEPLAAGGAFAASSPRQVAERSDVVITCLPSPAISAAVLEADDGVIAGLSVGNIWAEMSTTDHNEVTRLGALVSSRGASPMDCPVSGGCHRAATGNISILAGGDRETFERMLPLLAAMGREILHTGPLGSASVLKVITNYLASANLWALCEALVTAERAGMDLGATYEAIRISSGNSFVHETESQLILNGSRDIDFTMELVVKDVGLFQSIGDEHGIPLELSPLLVGIFNDGMRRYGPKEWSTNIVRRLEDSLGCQVLAPGFPAELVDHEPEVPGHEVVPMGMVRP